MECNFTHGLCTGKIKNNKQKYSKDAHGKASKALSFRSLVNAVSTVGFIIV